jgi:hypothetical protein
VSTRTITILGVLLLLVCMVPGAWADTTVNLQLVSVSGTTQIGGVYTSPYGISINGGATTVPMICDDYITDINTGYSWTATVNTLTTIDNDTVNADKLKFADSFYNQDGNNILGGSTASVAQDYAIAAVLSAELMFSDPTSEGAAELSYAIWTVFDQNLWHSLVTTGNTGWGSLNPTQVEAVGNAVTTAQQLVNNATTNGVVDLTAISIGGHTLQSLTVYTPPLTSSTQYPQTSQEFLRVSVPEPSYAAVFGLDLLGLGGLMWVFRRRFSSKLK